MKVCPRCNKTYDDNNLNFCLDDGELLMEQQTQDAPPTIMFDSPRQTNENWGDFDTGFSEQNQPNQQIYQPPFASPQTYSTTSSLDQTLPIISLVTGILGALMCWCLLGFVFGPVALITGYIGMNNANKNPDKYGGKTLATVGMILGIVSFGLSVIYIILSIIGSIN